MRTHLPTSHRHAVPPSRFTTGVALALLCTLALPLRGQVVDGRLVDRETGDPVPDAHVVLIDDAGQEVYRTATNPEGRFSVRAGAAGAYTLHAERVGFHVAGTRAVRLAAGARRSIEFAATSEPVALTELEAGRAFSCGLEGDTPARTVWREARKGLHAVVWTADYRPFRYDARVYEREVAPDGVRIVAEDDSVLSDARALPFASADPDQVAADGYVVQGDDGGLTFFALDPRVLLSDDFESGHCFRVTRAGLPGEIGLAFVPGGPGDVVEVAGTMWLDEATGAVTRVEYGFVGGPPELDVVGGGGSLAVRRLGGSDWTVTAWQVRMPRAVPATAAGADPLTSFTVVGGTVTAVRDDGGAGVLYAANTISVLRGAVHDSTSGGPLSGAAVAILGTDHWAATDRNGEFFLAGNLDGRYSVVFGSPRLDSLGFMSPATIVTLEPGGETLIDLATPSLPTILASRCGNDAAAGTRRVLHGVVRDGESGAPVPGAVVSVMRGELPEALQELGLDDLDASAVADTLGRYTICGVPLGQTIVVSAMDFERHSDFVAVSFAADAVQFDRREPLPLEHGIGRLDIDVLAAGKHENTLSGMVTNAISGEGVAGATVQIDGTRMAARTDSTGTFRLGAVPSGMLRIIVRRIGYGVVRRTVDFTDGGSVVFSSGVFEMEPTDALVLDPINVEAEGVAPKLTGFEQRRTTRFGSYMGREDFEKHNPGHATDILRRMRGIRVVPNQMYGVGGDTRRFILSPSRDIGQRITQVIEFDAERATTNLGGGMAVTYECPVLLFLDGMYVGDSRSNDVDNIVTPSALVGVEVYSPSQVPPEFALPGSACGVAVFWTR